MRFALHGDDSGFPARERCSRLVLGSGTVGRRVRPTGSGFILLEVVLSISLLLLGLTFIGAQINKSEAAAYENEDLARVLMLAESKLAELDTGLVYFDEEADDEVEGDFTLRFPDYGWRMRFDETVTEGLQAITLEILHGPRETLDDEFEVDDAEVVYRLYTLRAVDPVLDVEVDLGLDEETIEGLSETLPEECFDPPFYNPRCLQDLPFEDLVEMLPTLIGLFGDRAGPLVASLPPDMRAMLDLSGSGPGSESERGAELEIDSGPAGSLDDLSDEDLRMFDRTRRGELDRSAPRGGVERGSGERRPPRSGGRRQPPSKDDRS